MFDAPELPDFDSMSQDELLAWIARLAQDRAKSAGKGDADDRNGDGRAADNGWSGWLDDTQPTLSLQPPADDDTPTDLLLDDNALSLPPDAIDWLQELAADDPPETLPDITDYRAPDSASLSDLLSANAEDDALAWLDNLAGDIRQAPRIDNHLGSAASDYGADFNEEYEDDESLDDLEDESLYSPRGKRKQALVAALLGLQERHADKAAAQPAAPAADGTSQKPRQHADRLTQAFMLHADLDELETWYAARVTALEGGQAAAPPPVEEMPQPVDAEAPTQPVVPTVAPDIQTPPPPAPVKPPPPGLAAAINSARETAANGALDEALTVYETLLRTPAGLDWVVTDMRALIDEGGQAGNPAVHRVLGDALMRLDRLDDALSAYRRALSLL